MSVNNLSHKELETLRSLYLDGQLSREEEKALYLILSSDSNLGEENKNLLRLMESERKVFSYPRKRNGLRMASFAAASVLLLVSIFAFTWINISYQSQEATYTVWQNGEKLPDDEAQKFAEENQQRDMEMIRQVMRSKREMIKRNFASVDLENYDL